MTPKPQVSYFKLSLFKHPKAHLLTPPAPGLAQVGSMPHTDRGPFVPPPRVTPRAQSHRSDKSLVSGSVSWPSLWSPWLLQPRALGGWIWGLFHSRTPTSAGHPWPSLTTFGQETDWKRAPRKTPQFLVSTLRKLQVAELWGIWNLRGSKGRSWGVRHDMENILREWEGWCWDPGSKMGLPCLSISLWPT